MRLKNVTPGRSILGAALLAASAGLPVLAHAQSNTTSSVDLSPMTTSMTSMITLGVPVAVAIGGAVFGFAALLWIIKRVQTAK